MTAKKNSDDRLTITVNPSCMSEDDSERFGSLLKDGRCGFAHDEEKAAIFYEASASCADGNLEAVTDRGELYLSGKSMEEDIDKAFMYFNEAALEGQARGMTGVGLTYEERGDDHMAAEWYRAAALLGDDAALYNYADMLHKGQGIKEDKKAACEIFRILADKGSDEARVYFYLGLYADYGYGGCKKDYKEAMRLYKIGDRYGDPYCSNSMGILYRYGRGVTKDVKKALRCHMRSARLGNTLACGHVGWCYEKGLGTVKNMKKAESWYKKGARGGDPYCIDRLKYIHKKNAD